MRSLLLLAVAVYGHNSVSTMDRRHQPSPQQWSVRCAVPTCALHAKWHVARELRMVCDPFYALSACTPGGEWSKSKARRLYCIRMNRKTHPEISWFLHSNIFLCRRAFCCFVVAPPSLSLPSTLSLCSREFTLLAIISLCVGVSEVTDCVFMRHSMIK